MTTEAQRCNCAECRELDLLPVELQGCPGGYQLTLFSPPRPKPMYPRRTKR
jgi:hypothetical protein